MPFFIPDIKFKIVKKHTKQEILSIFFVNRHRSISLSIPR